MRRRYVNWVVLSLALVVLIVEGYLGYRWYQRYHGSQADTSSAVASAPGGAEEALPEEPEPEGGGGDVLVHRATPDNILDNSTYIDHPASNGNPDAVILVTQAQSPADTPANAHPIGVWYDENRGGRWAIFNEDLAAMPQDAIFHVLIVGEPGANAIVHRTSPTNTDGESTYLDYRPLDAAPDAAPLITPNWNPGGGRGTYNDHLVSVGYDDAEGKWAIRNEDLAPLPGLAAFNVFVRSAGTG